MNKLSPVYCNMRSPYDERRIIQLPIFQNKLIIVILSETKDDKRWIGVKDDFPTKGLHFD